MNKKVQSQRFPAATLAGVGAIALWCFNGLCYAVGSRRLGAMPFLCISSVVGVVTIVVLHVIRRMPVGGLFCPPWRVVIAGFFGIVVYSLLLGAAMGMAAERDLAHVMLMNYLWPIWMVLLGLLLLPERTRTLQAVAGALLGFAGVLIARGTEAFRVPAASLIPHAMAATGALLWALYSVLIRRWKVPAERGGSTLQFALLSIAAALLALRDGSWRSLEGSDSIGLLFTFFAGVGPVGLGYYWWEIGIKRGKLQSLAALSYFIPIVSTLLIAVWFQKAAGALLIPAAGLIALGAWIGQTAGRRG